MKPADKLLPRLDKVRQLKSDQWAALCPAHTDRTPSLRVTEIDDTKLLLKCWAGCSAREIVTAVGLDMRDLFPDGSGNVQRLGPSRAAIDRERMICRIGHSLIAQGAELSTDDRKRLNMARNRLASAGLTP